MQLCSADYLDCVYILVCVLHFVQISPLVGDVLLTPVSLWPLFKLCVTFLAKQLKTCACVGHSSS